MKKTVLLIFLISFSTLHSQEVYKYEKKIEHIENYDSQEVEVNTSDNIKLFGTLIAPKSEYDKIVIIVSGSGPISQYAHNYLTENLLENNIGVFRFDKRGIGKSGGYISGDAILYATDLKNVFNKIKSIEKLYNKKIGAIGQSLGGLATIESIKLGVKYDFLIQWSTPVGKPRDLVAYQIKQGSKNYDDKIRGKTLDERLKVLEFVHSEIDENSSKGTWEIWEIIKKHARKNRIKKSNFKNYVVVNNVEFAKLDNTELYTKLNIPTLYIIGQNDKLVNPIGTLEKLREVDNDKIEVKEFIGLNHFLRKDEIKMSQLNNNIFNIDDKAKKFIVDWIKEK